MVSVMKTEENEYNSGSAGKTGRKPGIDNRRQFHGLPGQPKTSNAGTAGNEAPMPVKTFFGNFPGSAGKTGRKPGIDNRRQFHGLPRTTKNNSNICAII